MKPVRVLQFITPAGFYGAERWVLALANNLNTEFVECMLAVTDEGGTQDLAMVSHWPGSDEDIVHIPMNGRFDWRVIGRLCQVIRDHGIDVVHTHGYKSDIIGWAAARKAGVPCVSTPHGFSGDVGLKMKLFIGVGSFLLRYFDAVAPLSEGLRSDMANLKVPAHRTRMIQNGVDLKEIDERRFNKTEVGEPVFTVGFIGQMIPRKGISDLIRAFDRFHEEAHESRLILVGDGHERPELERLASSLPSCNVIEFTGFREDRLDLLQQFDVFAMTSSLEGIPRCMMEAMAVETPVVAYDIPGVDLLIENRKTGLSVPHGDEAGLSGLFQDIRTNPQAARKRAMVGKNLIDTNYSAKRMAEEYQQLFAELRDLGHLSASAAEGVTP